MQYVYARSANLGVLSDGTKCRTCREQQEFKTGTKTIHVVGFLHCPSKQELIDIGVLEHSKWLMNKKCRLLVFKN